MFRLIPHNPPSITLWLAQAPPYKHVPKAEKLTNADMLSTTSIKSH